LKILEADPEWFRNVSGELLNQPGVASSAERIPAMREHELRNFSGRDSLVFATTTRMTDGLD
jgi:hypothetical protein